MDFIVEKDPGLIPQVLSKILDSCVNGVTLADPDQEDMPLIYVNKAFETITVMSVSGAYRKSVVNAAIPAYPPPIMTTFNLFCFGI